MKKSMRFIACAAAIMITGSMFVPNINAADTTSQKEYVRTIIDPITEAIFIVESENNDDAPVMYYWSTKTIDQFEYPVKIEDLNEEINLSGVKKIITISPKKLQNIYLDCVSFYRDLFYNYDNTEIGWQSHDIYYDKKNFKVEYTSEDTEPSEDTSSLVPLTNELLMQYKEVSLKEAIFNVEFADGHNEEYYWSTEMKLPVKMDEIENNIVDPTKIKKMVTVTPDNNKKTIIERETSFARISYNYSTDKWEDDGNYIPKQTKGDDAIKYYTENAIREAVIIVENDDGSTEKYYVGMEQELPVKIDEINKDVVDLSKVEKVIYSRDYYNRIVVEKSKYYLLISYFSGENGEWSIIEISPLYKVPPIDYVSEAPSIQLPAGSITGDVNKDSVINIVDLIKLKYVLLSGENCIDSYNCDVNSDRIVSAADIVKLKSMLLECE